MANLLQKVDGSAAFDGKGVDAYGFAFTAGAEDAGAANSIDLTMQLTGVNGRSIQKQIVVRVWTGADGGAATAFLAATATLLSPQTGTLVKAIAVNQYLDVATDTTGLLVMRVTEAAGAHTRYVYVKLPDGRLLTSPQLTFA